MYHSMLLSQKYVQALWTPGVITNLFSSYVQSTPFRMHLQATFALHRILEKYHLNREAFEWVLGEVEVKFNHDCKSYFYLFFWSASHILIVISRVQSFARTNNCKSFFFSFLLECNRLHVRTIASLF